MQYLSYQSNDMPRFKNPWNSIVRTQTVFNISYFLFKGKAFSRWRNRTVARVRHPIASLVECGGDVAVVSYAGAREKKTLCFIGNYNISNR